MHCEVRLEMLLNVQLILLEHQFDLFGTCIGLKNFVKVTSHTVLLVVEALGVEGANLGVRRLAGVAEDQPGEGEAGAREPRDRLEGERPLRPFGKGLHAVKPALGSSLGVPGGKV